MRKKHIKIISGLIFILVLISSCEKNEDNPIIPSITMRYIVLNDTIDALENPIKRFTLVFDLKDGDGNIGLRTQDTTGVFSPDSMFHYNCFLQLYKVKPGDTSLVETGAPLQYRIPYIEPKGRNKNLEAEVSINIDMTQSSHTASFKNIMFKMYIYDRAFNKSNTIKSPVVPFAGKGIYAM